MKTKRFLQKFIDKFVADDTLTLAASLAFYAALSLAPFLILFVSIAALITDDLQQRLIEEVTSLAGPDAADAVNIVVRSAKRQTELSTRAGLTAVVTLFISSSLIFGQLRFTLNRVFSVHLPHAPIQGFLRTIWDFTKARTVDVGLAAIFLLFALGTVLISTLSVARFSQDEGLTLTLINALLSALLYMVFFTLIFHYLPEKRVRWARALQGGMMTSILFVIGKEFIAYYLGSRALASAYGAAGSLIALLAWVYYSSLIIFVGAQFSVILNPSLAQRPKN